MGPDNRGRTVVHVYYYTWLCILLLMKLCENFILPTMHEQISMRARVISIGWDTNYINWCIYMHLI